MEGDTQSSQKSVEVNFQNLHGNMNYESKNEETESGESNLQTKKLGENVIKNGFQEESGDLKMEGEDKEATKVQQDSELEDESTQNEAESENQNGGYSDADVQQVAKELIDKVVTSAAEEVKNSNLNIDDEKESEKEATDKKESEDEWLDILGNGLLKKKVIKPGGGTDTRPKRDQEVTIKYEARLKDGTFVESEDKLLFILSDMDVASAIDLSVSLMAKGEKATVTSDAKYTYGKEGKPPMIPPNSDLVYEIEVLDVQEGPYNPETPLEKRLEWADKKREQGNMFYSKKDYARATQAYSRCTKVLEQAWLREAKVELKRAINALRIKCYNNLAASQMKLENWKDALKSCRAAEKLEPENVKALFRKGKVHVMLGELDKGTQALAKASKLEPDNKTIAAELAKQKRRLEQQKEAQKKMYRRMLGTNDDNKQEQKSSWLPGWGRMVAGTLALGAVLLGVYIAQKV